MLPNFWLTTNFLVQQVCLSWVFLSDILTSLTLVSDLEIVYKNFALLTVYGLENNIFPGLLVLTLEIDFETVKYLEQIATSFLKSKQI